MSFSRKLKTKASELLENPEDMLPEYCWCGEDHDQVAVYERLKCSCHNINTVTVLTITRMQRGKMTLS